MNRSIVIGIVSGLVLSVLVFSFGITQVSELAGLAVAQGTRWIGVRDASTGDHLTNGILSSALMMFDSANGDFNRLRGTTTFGILVDVSRISGTVTVQGSSTPSDTFSNPSNAVTAFALNGIWDGTQWLRWRAFQNIDNISISSSPHVQAITYGFDGSTFDRIRTVNDNVSNPTSGKLATLPCIARSSPTAWTDGNIVPCNTSLLGSIRVTQFDVPGSGTNAIWNMVNAQGGALFNSQTTGAANTAVVVTIPASSGVRAMLHSLEAQCSVGSSSITVQDGSTVIFTSMGNNVPAAPLTYRREFPGALTGSNNTAMTITLAACGAGGTGTLHVHASRW